MGSALVGAGTAPTAPFVVGSFVYSILVAVVIGIVGGRAMAVLYGGHPVAVELPPSVPLASTGIGFWLVLRAFANGCTAMTGVEAISNGISAFKVPAVRNAQRTLAAVVATLAVLLGGIALLCRAYGINATDPDSAAYQSILSQLTAAVAGRGAFYYLTMGSVVAIVCLSANTSFADFPRLCRLLALDNFLPYAFASRSRRLVNASGIVALALMSGTLLVAFGGVTDRLIPLFAIGAFGAFTLSQAGMVMHWRTMRATAVDGPRAHGASMAINAVGALSTGLVLLVVLVTKFTDGAWIVLLLIPALTWLFVTVQRHYAGVARETACRLPLDLAAARPPIVVVVMRRWSTITRNALKFAMSMSGDVVVLHVRANAEDGDHLESKWRRFVRDPLERAGMAPPRLLFVESPYRLFLDPFFATLKRIEAEAPGRTIAVVVPELAGGRWYDYVLHNQRSTALKAAILLRGGPNLVLVNVPWRMGEASAHVPSSDQANLPGEDEDAARGPRRRGSPSAGL